MEKRRPQLSVDDLQQLKWLLGGTLALLAIWTVLYMELDTWTLLVPATLAVGTVLIWPRIPARIPSWVHTAAFPVIVAVFLADLFLNGQVLPAMIRLDLLLIVYRCVGYRARRDDLQLIVLGLFLVVVAGVLTVSLGFALQILAFTACGLAFLFVITLVDATEAKFPAPRTPLFAWGLRVETPAWTERSDWRRLFARLRQASDWRLLVLGGLFFAGVVVVSALLFLAIPRFQLENTFFLDRFIARKSRTGFSENIKFGEVTDIMSDNSRALSIDIADPTKVPAVPYLRMVVLDEYRDGGFRMSPQLRRDNFEAAVSASRVRGVDRLRAGEFVPWTFYFEAGISRYLPIPGAFDTLRFEGIQNVAASPYLRIVALEKEPVSMVAYRVDGISTAPTLSDPGFELRIRPAARMANGQQPAAVDLQLGLPEFSPAERAVLARAIAAFTDGLAPAEAGRMSPVEFAQRACAWLAVGHAYSLQSSLPSGAGDPLVRWIDGQAPGHCELFAGAFVVLAREAGFPTRLVTGFKGGTWNAFTGNLTVRDDHAHAWCEIWDGAKAWVRVDPTPGSAVVTDDGAGPAAALNKRFDSSWSARLDSLRILWYRRVVNFDQGTQLETLRNLSAVTQAGGQRVRAALERIVDAAKTWLRSPWNTRRVAGVTATGAGVVLLAWAWSIWGRGLRWRWGTNEGGRRVDPVRAEAGRWLLRIAECGLPAVGPAKAGPAFAKPSAWQVAVAQTLDELLRLRYAAPGSWPKADRVFVDARRVWREARKRRA